MEAIQSNLVARENLLESARGDILEAVSGVQETLNKSLSQHEIIQSIATNTGETKELLSTLVAKMKRKGLISGDFEEASLGEGFSMEEVQNRGA